jgi:hypothetical protein
MRQAELWRALARQHLARNAPPEIAENALLASILAFGEVGQWGRVGEIYTELATVDLDPSRCEHYARVALRYVSMKDEPLETSSALSHPLRQDTHFTEVWHVDVIEWEQRGSAAEACADVLLDKRWPDLIRRKAMLARLTALPIDEKPEDTSSAMLDARLRLAEQLAQLQLYAVLSPLEKLFARDERRVKMAVLQSLQTLFFKRSFVTVRAALRDPDPHVVEQACKAVETLYFPHAVDPLSRILRESADPAPRASALRALARIDTLEAADILLGVLEHGAPADRLAALGALKSTRGSRFVELARGMLQGAKQPLRGDLLEVLTARGLAA